MPKTQQEPLNLGWVSCDDVVKIVVMANGNTEKWIWNTGGYEERHSHKIHDFDRQSDGDQWFLFCTQDSNNLEHVLVRGGDWQGAYDSFVDYAAEHCGIVIDENEMPDYMVDGEFTGHRTSDGQPVDTEAIHGEQVELVSIHFKTQD